MKSLEISPDFQPIWQQEGGFEALWHIEGKLYRQVQSRRTLRFVRAGRSFFIKIHGGVGWAEIFKNLLSFRKPVLSAENEYRAIHHLNAVGVATPKLAAYAKTGINPAGLRSLIVTEDLGDSISLEDLCRDWRTSPPDFRTKLALIAEVADISRRMHESGANHRDFYLCHFLRRRADDRLYLIDLHRAQIRDKLPLRWRIKDLAGLYFSAMDIGLTQRDLLRFIRLYRQHPLKKTLREESGLWAAVARKARRLYEQPIRG